MVTCTIMECESGNSFTPGFYKMIMMNQVSSWIPCHLENFSYSVVPLPSSAVYLQKKTFMFTIYITIYMYKYTFSNSFV